MGLAAGILGRRHIVSRRLAPLINPRTYGTDRRLIPQSHRRLPSPSAALVRRMRRGSASSEIRCCPLQEYHKVGGFGDVGASRLHKPETDLFFPVLLQP